MSKYSITDSAHLSTLDAQLKDNLFIGGHSPNAEDALVFEQFVIAKTEPNQENHLNLWSWFSLVVLFEDHVRQQWKSVVPIQPKAEAKPTTAKKEAPKKEAPIEEAPKKEAPKPEAAKDECDDLFGDDGEDESAKLEEMKKKKQQEKPKKPEIIAKSLIIIEVKVWEQEQDLDALATRILAIEKDGLFWKTEYKLAEIAFGMKKIVMGLVVEDEKVSIDDIIEELQAWEDDIQSVDITSFNKI
jgi:elongation factor 1-beta